MEKKYYGTIDYMRAVLIILVILVHIVNFGRIHPDIKSGILTFLMPAFLLITGYLVNIEKAPSRFIVYLSRIFLPYIIMATGYMAVSLYAPVNDGISTFDLPTVTHVLFVTSIGPYWFLHTIFICSAVYYISFRICSRLGRSTQFFIYAMLLFLIATYTPLMNVSCAVFFATGCWIRIFINDFSKCYWSSFLPLLPLLLILFDTDNRNWTLLTTMICVFCFFSVTGECASLSGGGAKTEKVMTFIGRNTFPIYIFHPIFTMGAKYMQPLFAFDSTGITHAIITIVACIAGSLLIAYVMDAVHLSFIFGRKKIIR